MADISVAGRWFAPHYAVPERRIAAEDTPLLRAPEERSESLGALKSGESFDVLEVSGGWAWGSCTATRLVAYVRADALAA